MFDCTCIGGSLIVPRQVGVGGGIRQWAKQRKRSYLRGGAVIGRAMRWRRKAVTNYCRLRGGMRR